MNSTNDSSSKRPSVVPKVDIPVEPARAGEHLEVRPFRGHEVLFELMPKTAVALAWVRAFEGQRVSGRSHQEACLVIVLRGSAELTGSSPRPVAEGDVVTIPPGEEYGFRKVAADGLLALQVEFQGAERTYTNDSLDALLAHNELRSQRMLRAPFFSLLRERGLDTEKKRNMVTDCLRVFADAFQVFLFTREATCRDEHYKPLFHQHLLEEIGHNQLLNKSNDPTAFRDPILRATSAWFCHRMLTMDNADKTTINLVLETAGYHLGILAGPLFEGRPGEQYFDTHGEADEVHKDAGTAYLGNHGPATYRRLIRVLDESWDMLNTMTERIVHLVRGQN